MPSDLQPSHPLLNVPKRSRPHANQYPNAGAAAGNANANAIINAPVQQQQQQQQQPAPDAAVPLHTKLIDIRPQEVLGAAS
eukprot:1150554-Rhodomonas_salina.1